MMRVCTRTGLTDCRLCDMSCGPSDGAMVSIKGTRVERWQADLAAIMAHSTWHLTHDATTKPGRLLRAS